MSLETAELLKKLVDRQTFVIQRARLLRRPQHEIDVLVTACDYLDDLDEHTPDLLKHLTNIANGLQNLKESE